MRNQRRVTAWLPAATHRIGDQAAQQIAAELVVREDQRAARPPPPQPGQQQCLGTARQQGRREGAGKQQPIHARMDGHSRGQKEKAPGFPAPFRLMPIGSRGDQIACSRRPAFRHRRPSMSILHLVPGLHCGLTLGVLGFIAARSVGRCFMAPASGHLRATGRTPGPKQLRALPRAIHPDLLRHPFHAAASADAQASPCRTAASADAQAAMSTCGISGRCGIAMSNCGISGRSEASRTRASHLRGRTAAIICGARARTAGQPWRCASWAALIASACCAGELLGGLALCFDGLRLLFGHRLLLLFGHRRGSGVGCAP